MEPLLMPNADLDDGGDEEMLVHEWRAEQLRLSVCTERLPTRSPAWSTGTRSQISSNAAARRSWLWRLFADEPRRRGLRRVALARSRRRRL